MCLGAQTTLSHGGDSMARITIVLTETEIYASSVTLVEGQEADTEITLVPPESWRGLAPFVSVSSPLGKTIQNIPVVGIWVLPNGALDGQGQLTLTFIAKSAGNTIKSAPLAAHFSVISKEAYSKWSYVRDLGGALLENEKHYIWGGM